MITLRKLQKLPEGTRRRKFAVILQQIEQNLNNGSLPDPVYLKGLLESISSDNYFTGELRDAAADGVLHRNSGDRNELLRICNGIRHGILQALGAEPADWDFIPENMSAAADEGQVRTVYPISLYLDDLRSPFNIGSIFRSAESFGIEKIYLSSGCPSPLHKRAVRASMGCVHRVPWEVCSLDALSGPFFALECGGQDIQSFPFPASGTAIIGSEELGVGPVALKSAEESLGRVTIPLYGLKGSINVSVASGIMMSRWISCII